MTTVPLFCLFPKHISIDTAIAVLQERLSHVLQTECTSWYLTNPCPLGCRVVGNKISTASTQIKLIEIPVQTQTFAAFGV